MKPHRRCSDSFVEPTEIHHNNMAANFGNRENPRSSHQGIANEEPSPLDL